MMSVKKMTRYSVESRLNRNLHVVTVPTPCTHMDLVWVKRNHGEQ